MFRPPLAPSGRSSGGIDREMSSMDAGMNSDAILDYSPVLGSVSTISIPTPELSINVAPPGIPQYSAGRFKGGLETNLIAG